MASYFCYGLACAWLISILLRNTVHGSRSYSMDKSVHGSTSGHISYADGVEVFTNKTLPSTNIERFAWDASLSNVQPNDNGPNFINHYAALRIEGGRFYGAKGTLNVYGLQNVGANQSSSALIWIANGLDGAPNDHNIILAGWQVTPQRYGDHDTHFVVYWTADGGQNTGCYNLMCKGFVLEKSSKYIPGSHIRKLSTYNGDQYEMTFKISKDSVTGDWWLHVGRNGDIPVGHWPKSLFTSLAESAQAIQWGGVVAFYPNDKSPPMGSGHFPEEGERKAAYLKDYSLVLKNGNLFTPSPGVYQDKTNCYKIGGDGIYFGGPGGCTD